MQSIRDAFKFLQDVWREVHPRHGKVSWPTGRAVRKSTLIVVVASVLLSLYITLCDAVVRFAITR